MSNADQAFDEANRRLCFGGCDSKQIFRAGWDAQAKQEAGSMDNAKLIERLLEAIMTYRREDGSLSAADEIARLVEENDAPILTALSTGVHRPTLEMAAKVAENGFELHRRSFSKDWNDAYETACNYIASAIRALGGGAG